MGAAYRPRISNGEVTRRVVATKPPAALGRIAREPRAKVGERAGVFWTLAVTGCLVAAGFVAGLHWQLAAYRANRNEARLRAQLDRAINERRTLEARQAGVESPLEIKRRTQTGGSHLALPKLDDPSLLRAPAARLWPIPTTTALPRGRAASSAEKIPIDKRSKVTESASRPGEASFQPSIERAVERVSTGGVNVGTSGHRDDQP
jgi:hypothetical protein